VLKNQSQGSFMYAAFVQLTLRIKEFRS